MCRAIDENHVKFCVDLYLIGRDNPSKLKERFKVKK